MGAQCYTSRPVSDTLNPKWNFNCQFFIKDVYQDVLCITVFEKDQFSPDGTIITIIILYSVYKGEKNNIFLLLSFRFFGSN